MISPAPLTFTVYGHAQPGGSKRAFKAPRTGRVIVTEDNKRSKPWQAEVKAAAAAVMNGGGLHAGPLRVELAFYVPRPKGHYGARGILPSAPVYPASRPDVLKLARAVEDALSGIVYRDDAQIVIERLTKSYGEPARVEIEIAAL